MTRTNEDGTGLETKATRAVVVVYEDRTTRERAIAFCDQLVGRFWPNCELGISWWPFEMLGEPTAAREAAERARCADLIIFSATPEGDFPLSVHAWIESWLDQRGDREGVMVGLMEGAVKPSLGEERKHHCLRSAAHRGAMDYLTKIPEDILRSIPDSLDYCSERADRVTSLLDDILHQQRLPPSLLV